MPPADYADSPLVRRATSRIRAAAHLEAAAGVTFEQALTTLNACALDSALEELRQELEDISGKVDNTDALVALRSDLWAALGNITDQLRAVSRAD